jgi:hypothetical protein
LRFDFGLGRGPFSAEDFAERILEALRLTSDRCTPLQALFLVTRCGAFPCYLRTARANLFNTEAPKEISKVSQSEKFKQDAPQVWKMADFREEIGSPSHAN